MEKRGLGKGLGALIPGADPELIPSGAVQLRLASLHEDIRKRGDAALADVPGLLEQLTIPQLRQLWPAGRVKSEKKQTP